MIRVLFRRVCVCVCVCVCVGAREGDIYGRGRGCMAVCEVGSGVDEKGNNKKRHARTHARTHTHTHTRTHAHTQNNNS